ncbi:MAG: hypothetical protein J6X55_17195 [Victivallales bacterium]|nr:hypothetical protein [Victivallales bacterium]
MKDSSEITRWIKKHLLRDFWRRLIALVLALVTWTSMRMMLMTHRNMPLKVRVEYDRNKYFISSDHLENAVNVRVDAVGTNISGEDIDDVTNYDLYVTLNPQVPNQKQMSFTLNDIKTRKLPDGITLASMKPTSFSVPYDPIISKMVRLKEPLEMPLENNKKLTIVDMSAKEIRLTGPSQYIHDITDLSLENLEPQKIDMDLPSQQVSLSVKNPYPTLEKRLVIEPSVVYLDTRLEDVVRDKEVALNCPLKVLMLPADMKITSQALSDVTVVLRGDSKLVEKLDRQSILAYINLDGILEDGKRDYPIQAGGIPTNVHYELRPAMVTLELEKTELPPSAAQPQENDSGGESQKNEK